MDWLRRMNEAVGYIEDHLEEEIDYNKVASIACCSSYHFQRMFSYMADVPLSEYIRRRRLSLAAFELQKGKSKIIDIAFKYGYESPSSFARAFQTLHGIVPSAARNLGVPLSVFPRIFFYMSIKGNTELRYRIEEKEAFSVFGTEFIINGVNESYQQIPALWKRVFHDGTADRMLKASQDSEENNKGTSSSSDVKKLLNAAIYDHNRPDGTYRYMICFNLPQRGPDHEFKTLQIPPCTWAIFQTDEHTLVQTTEKIQALWKRIYPDWFPSSGYDYVSGPEFEMYYHLGGETYVSEIWLPVQKK